MQRWNFPTTVLFGPKVSEQLPTLLQAEQLHRPLWVVDPALPSQVYAHLAVEQPFTAFSGNPTSDDLGKGLEAFKEGGHDCVIALGGGSAMDIAKTIAFMAKQTRPVWDFEDVGDNYLRANTGICPIFAVPTTAGTGSEVGRASVLTCPDRKEKKIIFHPQMLPRVALLDPTLTVSLPAFLTAATGMDALAHSLEAYCAPGFHPMADGIALEGMALVKESLLTAVQSPEDLQARGNMQVAALMGATAFQKGLGAIHSLSHPVGARYNLHHGLLNAIFMPYVLKHNASAIEEKCARIGQRLSLPDKSAQGVINWVVGLNAQLGIPDRLSALGDFNLDADIQALSAAALADPSTGGNPVSMTHDDMRSLLEKAWLGQL